MVLVANDRWWGPKAITKRVTVWPQGADIQDRVNNRSVDVVDVAVGSSGALATPDNYQRSDSPSAGIEQLIFALQGPLALARERRALALCTPRDAIAKDAGVRSPTRGSTRPPTMPSPRATVRPTPAHSPRQTPVQPATRWRVRR